MKESIESVADVLARCGFALMAASLGVGALFALVFAAYKGVEEVVSDWKWRSRK